MIIILHAWQSKHFLEPDVALKTLTVWISIHSVITPMCPLWCSRHWNTQHVASLRRKLLRHWERTVSRYTMAQDEWTHEDHCCYRSFFFFQVYDSYYWPIEWELPARNKNSCYLKVICHILDHVRYAVQYWQPLIWLSFHQLLVIIDKPDRMTSLPKSLELIQSVKWEGPNRFAKERWQEMTTLYI